MGIGGAPGPIHPLYDGMQAIREREKVMKGRACGGALKTPKKSGHKNAGEGGAGQELGEIGQRWGMLCFK